MGLTADERALLDNSNFSFKPLNRAGGLDLGNTIALTVRPAAIFVFTLVTLTWFLRFVHDGLSILLCVVGNIALLAMPTVAAVVLVAGIIATAAKTKVRPSAVLYWSYWPIWTFILCWVALALGVVLGEYVWYECYQKYYELQQLQTYGMVDPSRTKGEQVQDAGVVDFANGVGIDRAKGGCFVNGRTYCIAPIIQGGHLLTSLGDAPSSGGYDYFAVGVDCCSCPNQDFRCGEWNNPLAQGGLRSIDELSRPFYALAADNWAATYKKEPQHPLFFEWVGNPKHHLELEYSRGKYFTIIPILGALPVFFCVAFLLNGIYITLVKYDLASPIESFEPPQALRGLFRATLPELGKYNAGMKSQYGAAAPLPWQPRFDSYRGVASYAGAVA